MKVNVIVKPKETVLDPQGSAVRDAMRHLGMPEVRSVRIGKYMEIEVEGSKADLEKRLRGLCRDLLSNPVIEDYQIQESDVSGSRERTLRREVPSKARAPREAGGSVFVKTESHKSPVSRHKTNGAKNKAAKPVTRHTSRVTKSNK